MKALFLSMLALLTLATWMSINAPSTTSTTTPIYRSGDTSPLPPPKPH